MKIAVVNPNTTTSMTMKIATAARQAAKDTTEIVALNPSDGPVSIEGFYDEVLAVPGMLKELAHAERRGADAAIIACFDDCGLDAARSLLSIPVIGICEAAVHMATLVSQRFCIVTTLPISLPAMHALARRYGVADRCTARAAGVAVLALEDPNSGAVDLVIETIRRAIEEDGAECILLGCAGMADLAARLTAMFEIPVLDGVAAAVKLAEAMIGLGVKTSKKGTYARPSNKVYAGNLAAFAPQTVGTCT